MAQMRHEAFDNLVRPHDQRIWAESASRLELDGRSCSGTSARLLAYEDAARKALHWKVNMLDQLCRFPAIFEKLSVALRAPNVRP
jgi:hypothetical protein